MFFICLAILAQATPYTFSGTTGNWNVAANWNAGIIPGAGDDVTIGAGKVVTIPAGYAAVAQSVGISGGGTLTVAASASLVINGSTGTSDVGNGIYLTGTGTTLTNSGTINIGNNSAISLRGIYLTFGAQFNNNNSGNLTIDSVATYNGLVCNASSISNFGTIKIGNNSSIKSDAIYLNASSFTNGATGSIECNRMATANGINVLNSTSSFTNSGSIKIGNIAAVYNVGIYNSGTFINNAGATIEIDRITTLDGIQMNGGTVSNAGNIKFGFNSSIAQNGIYWYGGSVTNTSTGTMEFNGGVSGACLEMNASTTTFANSGIISINGGAYGLVQFSGTGTNSGTITINNTTMYDGLQVTAGNFTNTGTIKIGNTGPNKQEGIYLNGGTLTNSGTLEINNVLNTSTDYEAFSAAAGTFNNTSTGILSIGTSSIVKNGIGYSRGTSTTTFNNAGIINFGGQIALDAIESGTTVNNNTGGTINTATGGLLRIAGVFNNTGTVTNSATGILTVNGTLTNNAAGTVTNNGTLAGTGTITQNGTFNITSGSHIAPGNNGPGTLSVNGGFNLGSATLDEELNGATTALYDVLAVSGTDTLANASLNVVIAPSYTPANADVFTIINAGTLTGTFSSVQTAGLDKGYNYPTTGKVTLAVPPIITTGTINGNIFYAGSAITIPFTATGIYNSGNVFTAQLSDASGSFTSPVSIGTLSATSGTSIAATISSAQIPGTGYRIRVVSSNPVITSADNGTDLTINIAPTITTAAISGSPFSGGSSVNVAFNTTGPFGGSNGFTTQLSDATGSFTAPVTIGTGSTSPINATLPFVSTTGTGYRIRVVSSSPNFIGTNNGTDLTITAPTIATTAITGSPFDGGSSMSVPFNTTGSFGGSNSFTAQLSDASGSFAIPVTIGTASTSPISAILPFVSTTGTGYRIRVVSSSPNIIGTDNGTDLTITAPTITTTTISGSPFSAGSSVNVPFSTTGTFGGSNSFTAQLSDASGSFITTVTIGTGSTSPIASVIPTPVSSGTSYRIRVVSSVPVINGTDNGTNIVINGPTISTSTLSSSSYAAGATVSVPFTITGTYNTGNVFTAQLSNASGSFSAPISIGNLTGTIAGTITATIPASTTAGIAYRIRVVSSSLAVIGTDNNSDIAVTSVPNSLAFDGTNDIVTVPNAAGVNNFATTQKFTLECWVKPANIKVGTFINKGGGSGGEQYSLDLDGSGNIRFYIQGTAANSYNIISIPNTNISIGTWTHLAATYDAAGGIMMLYVNGVQKGSRAPSNSLMSNSTGLAIGAQANAAQFFNGQIDEVRIWNRALCASEILNNMNKELAPGQNGLVAYYKMNQGIASGANTSITTLTDASGSGSIGTLTNFALTNSNSTSNWVAGASTITGTTTAPFVETGASFASSSLSSRKAAMSGCR